MEVSLCIRAEDTVLGPVYCVARNARHSAANAVRFVVNEFWWNTDRGGADIAALEGIISLSGATLFAARPPPIYVDLWALTAACGTIGFFLIRDYGEKVGYVANVISGACMDG